ncbi:putative metal-dependent hydrolase [Dissulfuribacter thermophilus]|uniref:Putative metal-dependent hydrolase n=1 Tax=Dissulfuribacter thermophilus TaxID=1156395 RepID=A0A1B9F9I1_9BACT|nr:putative metal-dependent hydrolase [Dissulfuribacter thermophilus]
MIVRWEAKIGEKVNAWGIKRMRTKWGSCTPRARRIWLTLELAKKKTVLIEYVLVHEMTHFLEPSHNEHFKSLMDKFLPKWRSYTEELNSSPLTMWQ